MLDESKLIAAASVTSFAMALAPCTFRKRNQLTVLKHLLLQTVLKTHVLIIHSIVHEMLGY